MTDYWWGVLAGFLIGTVATAFVLLRTIRAIVEDADNG